MATGLEGRLEVHVHWDGERIVSAEPRSARPVDACRVLVGRRAEEALAMVPMLFSLCGRAQAAVAAHALAAAGEPQVAPLPDRAVAVESVLESLWRLLHDLPRALGEAPNIERFAPVRQALLASLGDDAAFPDALAQLQALLEQEVLGSDGPGPDPDAHAAWLTAGSTPVAGWLGALEEAGFLAWGTGATPLMTARPGREALMRRPERRAGEEGFAWRPDWLGRPVETGALAARQDEPLVRQLRAARGHDCATRLAARLVDLQLLVDGLANHAPLELSGGVGLGERIGLGWGQTARGLLLHRVALDASGSVADYRVLAPTEWNFHPGGALARGLEAQPVDDETRLRRGVTLAVLALDPCVAFGIEVERPRAAPHGV